MIRWYDYVACLLMADFILVQIKIALISPVWWQQSLAVFCAWGLYNLWLNVYCIWRLKQENERT